MKTVRQRSKRSLLIFKMMYHLCRLVLGSVLIYASIDKIVDPAAFGKIIFSYQLLPDQMINITAIVLPWLELVVGILLVFQLWMPGTIMLINTLFMVFTGAILSALLRGLDINCGCFSTSGGEGSINMITFFRDFSFIVMAFFLLIFTFFPQKIGMPFQKD